MPADAFGIIAPHPPIMVAGVGGRRAEVTRDSLDALAVAHGALERFDPEVIVVISPHAPGVSEAVAVDTATSYSGSLAQFGDDTVFTWQGDTEFARTLIRELETLGMPVADREADGRLRSGWLDHASLIPLSFLDREQRRAVVIVSLSWLTYASHRHIGEAARAAARVLDRRTAFVASGDLSHRLTRNAPAGYDPRGVELDERIVECVETGHFEALAEIDPELIEAGGECGLRSLIALGGFCGDDPVPTRVLAYEGPWGVGYLTTLAGSAALEAAERAETDSVQRGRKGGMAGEAESEIVSLARRTIERLVREGRLPADPVLTSEEYPARAGAFVSLHANGALRGCIGTILATRDTLAEEVVGNAVEAATRDPRFDPVRPDELGDLEIKVDVLHEPESCSAEELDPRAYGVITTSGYRRGLLLPDLEGVDDVKTQIAIAMQKAGIRPDEPCSLERFKVDRYT